MGAGILPTTLINGKLYFLFGKENKYADTPGYSDFGGGTDNNETYLQTAVREGGEELTGFLGSDQELKKKILKSGTFNIDYKESNYRMHIIPFEYDEKLPFYYNNNQKFLQKRLDPEVIKKSKIFEKAEIRWICVDELLKMRKQFRSYFQNIVDIILDKKNEIKSFIQKKMPNIHRNKMSKKSIMGLNFSREDYEDSEEEVPELVEEEKPVVVQKKSRKSSGSGRKSKKTPKGNNKSTRKQVRFSNNI
jgi:hypothetical protein